MRVKGENKIVFEVPDSVATALIAAGHLTEVTSHAAPEGDDHGVAPESSGDELVLDAFLDLAGFRGLPGGEDDEVSGPRAE